MNWEKNDRLRATLVMEVENPQMSRTDRIAISHIGGNFDVDCSGLILGGTDFIFLLTNNHLHIRVLLCFDAKP